MGHQTCPCQRPELRTGSDNPLEGAGRGCTVRIAREKHVERSVEGVHGARAGIARHSAFAWNVQKSTIRWNRNAMTEQSRRSHDACVPPSLQLRQGSGHHLHTSASDPLVDSGHFARDRTQIESSLLDAVIPLYDEIVTVIAALQKTISSSGRYCLAAADVVDTEVGKEGRNLRA